MSKTKNRMMDMEEHVWDAMKGGWTTLEEVQSYVKDHMDTVDEAYVEQVFHELDNEFIPFDNKDKTKLIL
tara:strand:+ start:1286 stop:1495 length:210 start_codon:yes stop_codon:yes gene_type:complete